MSKVVAVVIVVGVVVFLYSIYYIFCRSRCRRRSALQDFIYKYVCLFISKTIGMLTRASILSPG